MNPSRQARPYAVPAPIVAPTANGIPISSTDLLPPSFKKRYLTMNAVVNRTPWAIPHVVTIAMPTGCNGNQANLALSMNITKVVTIPSIT